MSVTNNGILPATARISMDPHSCFQLAPGPLLITLASKQSHRIAADFTATVVKQHAHEVSHMTPLLLHTLHTGACNCKHLSPGLY